MTETTPTPEAPLDTSFGSDSDGIRAAADELLRKRGAETEATEGAGDLREDREGVREDEVLTLNQGVRELQSYREGKVAALHEPYRRPGASECLDTCRKRHRA
jgi:hypothetical protein